MGAGFSLAIDLPRGGKDGQMNHRSLESNGGGGSRVGHTDMRRKGILRFTLLRRGTPGWARPSFGLAAAMFALMVMGAFALTPNSASADPAQAAAGNVTAFAEAFELPAFCAARNVVTNDGDGHVAQNNTNNAA